ncbi:HAD hydrolase family protein [Rhodobacteraceae bacterium D3-12]|nr:HAD hydrolase family protein [Rhodobacteraceae bacterium D3-12]
MTPLLPLLVFSDLDGTLIDHDSYGWEAAHPALARLREIGAGVILASSKTATEMQVIRAAMDLGRWPAIVENGAGVLQAGQGELAERGDYARLRAALARVPEPVRQGFRGFGDMSVAEIAEVTGLGPDAAERAAKRGFSEPGLWRGNAAERAAFIAALGREGIAAREGGRFLTLSFGQTKADRMAEMIAAFRPQRTVALGDAPNDVEMLEAADIGVVIANPHRAVLPPLAGEGSGAIRRSTRPGPEGWNEEILRLIAEIDNG